MMRTLQLSAISLLLSSAAAQAQSPATTPLFWPDKNGPTLDGVVPADSAEKLPTEWDAESGKNIVWRLPFEHEGHSTPVIGGDLIWFTSATKDGKKQWLHAVNRHTGKLVHDLLLFENADPEELGNPLNNYAAPSCVLEENAVYAHFGTYGTARIEARHRPKNLGTPRHQCPPLSRPRLLPIAA
jgi:outer membrane protein assembly factor BamB